MADVRSMLRAERESRRITHPHASYTSAGNLLCNICEVPIKSERAWGAHLHSTQHNLKLGRNRDTASSKATSDTGTSKKRKAVEFEEPPEAERKKVRPSGELPPSNLDGPLDVNDTAETTVDPEFEDVDTTVVVTEQDDVDEEAQYEALQRSLALLEQEAIQERQTVLSAAATISAPAMTAQELAAQAREEQSKQRTRRDEEVENEREDAVRALEEEFEEMDNLQERLKKLQERREALRKPLAVEEEEPVTSNGLPDRTVTNGDKQQAEDVDESEDDDDLDDWTFGAL